MDKNHLVRLIVYTLEHFPKFRSQPEIARAGRPRH